MWSLAGSQAVDQLICCFGPASHSASWSAALGLSRMACPSAALGLCVGQLAFALVRAHPRFQVWAPSLIIWVCTTGLQVSAGAAYPAFTVQGLRGEGCQKQGCCREFSN